jgi:hypothetical protein
VAYHGKNGRVYLNQYNLSGQSSNIEVGVELATVDASNFETGWQTPLIGIPGWTGRLNAFYDDTGTHSDAVFQEAIGASGGVLSMYPAGVTVGYRGYATYGEWETSYPVTIPVADAVTAQVAFRGNGALDKVICLAACAPTTSGSFTHAAVNYGASGASQVLNGYLHVMSVGASPVNVRVEHSPDNNTWATLLSFTQATAATYSQGTVTGSVAQYVRAVGVTAGAASYIVGFHRDE